MAHTIGIDEVGRGPLAGPVMVVALALPHGVRFPKEFGPLRDSKKLSELQRERWYAWVRAESGIRYAIARVSPARIDVLNITRAANLAAWRAYQRLLVNNKRIATREVRLDGGLYLKDREMSRACGARTIIRGDEKVPAIALASIIAKVVRDRYMKRMATVYPKYGFAEHSGYGTVVHRRAIRRHGPSPIHRLTFLR